jgi:hypothetical protein
LLGHLGEFVGVDAGDVELGLLIDWFGACQSYFMETLVCVVVKKRMIQTCAIRK